MAVAARDATPYLFPTALILCEAAKLCLLLPAYALLGGRAAQQVTPQRSGAPLMCGAPATSLLICNLCLGNVVPRLGALLYQVVFQVASRIDRILLLGPFSGSASTGQCSSLGVMTAETLAIVRPALSAALRHRPVAERHLGRGARRRRAVAQQCPVGARRAGRARQRLGAAASDFLRVGSCRCPGLARCPARPAVTGWHRRATRRVRLCALERLAAGAWPAWRGAVHRRRRPIDDDLLHDRRPGRERVPVSRALPWWSHPSLHASCLRRCPRHSRGVRHCRGRRLRLRAIIGAPRTAIG